MEVSNFVFLLWIAFWVLIWIFIFFTWLLILHSLLLKQFFLVWSRIIGLNIKVTISSCARRSLCFLFSQWGLCLVCRLMQGSLHSSWSDARTHCFQSFLHELRSLVVRINVLPWNNDWREVFGCLISAHWSSSRYLIQHSRRLRWHLRKYWRCTNFFCPYYPNSVHTCRTNLRHCRLILAGITFCSWISGWFEHSALQMLLQIVCKSWLFRADLLLWRCSWSCK